MKTLPERSAYAKAQRQERAGAVEEVPGDQCVGALRTRAESLRGGEERGWVHRGPTSCCPSSQGSALHGLFPLPQHSGLVIFSSFIVVYRDTAHEGTSWLDSPRAVCEE